MKARYVSMVYFETTKCLFHSVKHTIKYVLLDIARVYVLESACWNFVSRTKGSYTLAVLNISSFVHCYLCFLHT